MPLQLALKLNSYFVSRIYVHCAYVSTPQSHLVLYVPEGEDGAIGQHQAGLYRQLRRQRFNIKLYIVFLSMYDNSNFTFPITSS